MNTICKNCTFAIYEGTEQVGCEFNKLDNLPKKAKLVEAFDDEKEFFVLENFMCNTAREVGKWKYHDAPNKKEQALKEIELDYEVLINTEPYEAINILKSQELKPVRVNIFVDDDETKKDEILSKIRKESLPFKWTITNCLNGTDTEMRHRSLQSKAQYLCVIKEQGKLPDFKKINDYLTLQNGRFALLESDNCQVVSAIIYRTMGIDKIKPFAAETKEEEWVQECSQFWA